MVRQLLGVGLVLVLVGCGGSPMSADGRGGSGGALPPAAGEGSTTAPGNQVPAAGQLTAGMWDDNENFDWFVSYRDSLGQGPGMPPFTAEEQEAARVAAQQRTARTALEIAFVIDTTSSMGDELRYLSAEVDAIAAAIESGNPNVSTRWGLVAYKDEGDSYVVKGSAFQTSLSAFQTELAKLSPEGGGDFPEAPDAALDWAAKQLQWSGGANVARLVFWLADAPHHDKNAGAMAAAVRELRSRDVRVYPVASSGIDELAEYTMRASAQLTGGRYIFLTDDSGIGEAHKDPTIPCYFVTRLDHAIVRSVQSELRGTFVSPAAEDVIRAVGAPVDGVCTVGERQARAF